MTLVFKRFVYVFTCKGEKNIVASRMIADVVGHIIYVALKDDNPHLTFIIYKFLLVVKYFSVY